MNLSSTSLLLPAPATVDQVFESVAATLASNSGYRLNLLFDASAHPDGLELVKRHARRIDVQMFNLLDGLPEGDALEVGSFLVPVDVERARDVFDYWADPGIQSAAVWLWSQWDASRLAGHLRQFVLVQHRPEKTGLLRIADPHVWQALASQLEDSVGQMMCAPLGAWSVADLDAGWHFVTPSRRSSEKPASPLVFRKGDVEALEDAMWPTQIYFSLYPTIEQQPALGARVARLDAIRDEYRRAREWGGRDARDFVMFSSLADAFGTRFDSALTVLNALNKGKAQNARLADTLRSISDDDWEMV
jgi:hypothetical protein